eukprot:12175598-Ditylum_brightwellii.AAC.1
MTPSGEPATYIGNANERGSEAVPIMKDMTQFKGSQPPTVAMQMKGGPKQYQPQRIWHLQGSQPPTLAMQMKGVSKQCYSKKI